MELGRARTVSRRDVLALSGAALVGTAGCVENPRVRDGGGGGDGGQGQVKIAGSSTVFPLAVQIRKGYQQIHPDVDVSIKSTGTGGGFANHFCPGATDFNNASRPITDGELDQCHASAIDPVQMKVATDAITVVVNNRADWFDENCITVETLAEIWSPETAPRRWSDVRDDWPDEEINLFGPTEASGTFDYFTEAIVGEEGSSRTDYQATEQDNTIITGVSKDRFAMGYLGFAYFSENREAVTALGIDDGDGCVEPTLETAKSGRYTPLARPLYSYVSKQSLTREAVRSFARFWLYRSTSTELVAETVGYVPNSEAERIEQAERLERAIEEATG